MSVLMVVITVTKSASTPSVHIYAAATWDMYFIPMEPLATVCLSTQLQGIGIEMLGVGKRSECELNASKDICSRNGIE